MKEINEVVNAKLEEMTANNVIAELVEKNIEKAISEAVTSQFTRYGGVSKQIEEILESKLKVDASEIDVPCFSQLLGRAVNTRVNEYFKGESAKLLLAQMDELFSPLPNEMSAQEFCEKIASYWKSDDPCSCSDDVDDYATVEITEENRTTRGVYYTLKIWKRRKERDYSSFSSSSQRERRPDVEFYICDGKIRLRHFWNPTCLDQEEELTLKAFAQQITLTGLENADPDCWDLSLGYEYD